MAYIKEREIAELAVQRAAILTKKVFHEKAKGTSSKDDKSPVTIGDFGAQALIIHAIRQNFPNDEIVAEEEAQALRNDSGIRSQVWSLVRSTRLDHNASEATLGGAVASEEEMLTVIDSGQSQGGPQGRIWALDPIDGTKGFIRGGQYAVCLGLIVNGDVKVAAMACPNLPIDATEPLPNSLAEDQTDDSGKGVLFSAVSGEGAHIRPLSTGALQPAVAISMRLVTDISKATFCESVEAAHTAHDDHAAIAKHLGITGKSVRMDSQAKYGSIARGTGDIYLRLPFSKTYVERIWDHAAGDLIVREAGGYVTDANGNTLDFGKGRTLSENKGVVVAPIVIHAKVMEAVKSVLNTK